MASRPASGKTAKSKASRPKPAKPEAAAAKPEQTPAQMAEAEKAEKVAEAPTQKEVADRLVAKPETGEYGVLTVLTAVHADVSRVLNLPPGAFRPPPKVHSAVVRLTFRPPTVEIADHDVFVKMVRTMFTQRRKTVANALKPFGTDRGLAPLPALAAAGIDPTRRPETLTLSEMAQLANAFVAVT